MEAASFGVDLRRMLALLHASGYKLLPLYGEQGVCTEAHNAFRFRRIWVSKDHGVPFLSSANIIDMRPMAEHFISRRLTKRLDHLRVLPWDVLISCSGTIGNVALAGNRIVHWALSQDAIRLRADDPEIAGYVTAFLRSQAGRIQLTQAAYGSVVVHIEPEHLERIMVPQLPLMQMRTIGHSMRRAVELRDEANALLDKADSIIHQRIGLPPVDELEVPRPGRMRIRASTLQDRFEGSYHRPIVAAALKAIAKSGLPQLTIASRELTKELRAVTRFRKRVYVPHGGIPLLSTRQLFQVDPVDVKGLARGAHTRDLPEIKLEENMVLVTVSGTIGRTQIIPRYMEGWTANQHATRIIAADALTAGYLYAWLASDYGVCLTSRHAYGSVILELDRYMLGSVAVPMPTRDVRDEIGALVLEANRLRDEAWRLERDAISEVESLIGL
jgi:type I restriction enzyme, S subunit